MLPQALALFAWTCVFVALNALAVVKAALSDYYMAIEMRNLGESLDTILNAEDWDPFRRTGPQEMVA